jgi:hypothetical protein
MARSVVGAENLCHQAIFVDDAARVVTPPHPELIQTGDVIWQSNDPGTAQRRELATVK